MACCGRCWSYSGSCTERLARRTPAWSSASGLSQPSVSKHLGVLHRVGLVTQRRHGRQILYRTNAVQLKAIHDWTRRFERFWTTKLDRIKQRAERRTTTP